MDGNRDKYNCQKMREVSTVGWGGGTKERGESKRRMQEENARGE